MLTVATWNCAHGRSVGPDLRRLLPTRRRQTLEAIGATLGAHGVDVVALQELDGPSWWSGRFDHTRAVAERGGFEFGVHGHHVHWAGLRYGTALLSRRPLDAPASVRFAPSPPTPRKGFVVARTALDDRAVDVISVHLDFARPAARRSQLQQLTDFLAGRDVPRVVMGDVNDEPGSADLLAFFAATGLRPAPSAETTFPKLGRRLDVVLLSPELERVEQRVLPIDLSDHRPVVAKVRWAS